MKYEYTYFENNTKFLEYVPSVQAVDKWIREMGWSCEWHRFDISVDIPKRDDNYPLRAWTEMVSDGRKMIRDGIERIQDQYILEIIVQ